MQSDAVTVEEYLKTIPEDRKDGFLKLRDAILAGLPPGFEETMSYGMIGYVVPHRLYPAGYHVDPALPLPFMALASQKNHVALYHMGLYSDPALLSWFTEAWDSHSSLKLDMGKSCLRFRNPAKIPFELIRELAARMSVEEWIKIYETTKP